VKEQVQRLVGNKLPVDESSFRIKYSKKVIRFLKELPTYIKEYKSALIFIGVWIITADLAGFSFLKVFITILKLLVYPLYLILFNTEFKAMNIPEIFILMVPLVFFVLIGFLAIIATED
jgi:hypothetical protein